jgi:hypothetical protein
LAVGLSGGSPSRRRRRSAVRLAHPHSEQRHVGGVRPARFACHSTSARAMWSLLHRGEHVLTLGRSERPFALGAVVRL